MVPDQIVFEKIHSEYRASLGPWTGTGPTKAAAQADLLSLFVNWPGDSDPVTRIDKQGGVWVLWYEGRNWIYRSPSGCVTIGSGDKSAALRAMDAHIAQY